MGRPVESSFGTYRIDMSHQEVDRLVTELEEWYRTGNAEWILIEAASSWLRHDLGYEDTSEFEDALGGTFENFLSQMPHIEVGTDKEGRSVFKVKPEPPREEWKPRKLVMKVTESKDLWNVSYKSTFATDEIPEPLVAQQAHTKTLKHRKTRTHIANVFETDREVVVSVQLCNVCFKSTSDTIEIPEPVLWNVCYKSTYATIEIPELEFEISADGKRHWDSIYNHIAGAVFNLSNHCKGNGMSPDHQAKIGDCVASLNLLLDMDREWTFILHDPTGLSTIGIMDKVVVEALEDDNAPVREPQAPIVDQTAMDTIE
eukprot:gene21791-28811_t